MSKSIGAKSVKQNTGADLRALAEARLGAQAGPRGDAARRADVIRAGLTSYSAIMDKIAEAYQREDWKALGYESFNAYAGGEFGEARLKLSPQHRAQILPAFQAVGMSKRAIAAALGVNDKTIRNDLRGADNSAPPATEPQVVDDPVAAFDAKYAQTAAGEAIDTALADGAEEPRNRSDEAPAPSGGVEGASPEGVTHLVCQYRRDSMPACAVADGQTIGGAERADCPTCVAWLATREGWAYRYGASEPYPEDSPAAMTDDESLGSVQTQPGPDSSDASVSEGPAGQPLGSDIPEVVPVVATDRPGTDRPGTDRPLEQVGEARPSGVSGVASAQPEPVAAGSDESERSVPPPAGLSDDSTPDVEFLSAVVLAAGMALNPERVAGWPQDGWMRFVNALGVLEDLLDDAAAIRRGNP